MKINVELKYNVPDPGLAPAVIDLLRREKFLDQVVITSLDYAALQQVESIEPRLSTGHIVTAAVGNVVRTEADFLSLGSAQATRSLIRRAHAAGKEVHVWTVNKPEVMLRMIERGVDNVITDDPALLVRVMQERNALSPSEILGLGLRVLFSRAPPEANRSGGRRAALSLVIPLPRVFTGIRTSASSRVWTLIGTAAIVGLGYYAGVQVGLALRFPPATTSVLWPPNAILTAALLLTPIRRWWVCLAGALPVHFLIQRLARMARSVSRHALSDELQRGAHCCGLHPRVQRRAAALRYVSARRNLHYRSGPPRALALLIRGCRGRARLSGRAVLVVWQTRLFANALTELSVVPLVVLGVARGAAHIGNLSRGKLLEAALLGMRFRRGSAVHLRPRQGRPRSSGRACYADRAHAAAFFLGRAALRRGRYERRAARGGPDGKLRRKNG